MEAVFCVLVGLFFAVSIYLMLSAHLVRILIGVSILSNAVNLLIFTAGRLTEAAPPVLAEAGAKLEDPSARAASATLGMPLPIEPIAPEATVPMPSGTAAQVAADAFAATANPLPQALILTAIVISFSIFAFLLVLAFRAYQSVGTDLVDEMRTAEPGHPMPPTGY